MTAINLSVTMYEEPYQALNSSVSEVNSAVEVPLEATSPEIDELREPSTEESIVSEGTVTTEPEVTYPNFVGDLSSLEEMPVITVPENSRSILIQETTSRFSGAIWYEKIQEKNITLAGVGGIGRF